MKTDYIFELEMKVRDYECDLQGIVNNANYQHYIEHTRHEFLLAQGISFADLHAQGIDAVVARLNMAFKTPEKRRPFRQQAARRERRYQICILSGHFPPAGHEMLPEEPGRYRMPDRRPFGNLPRTGRHRAETGRLSL